VISDRALNRTLLRRQFLLDRVDRPALDVVEHLVGLQAQEPADPYVALWDRIAGFDPAELATAVATGDAVRIALQRSTIHLVSAADCAALRPVLQPALERMARSSFGTRLAGVDQGELAEAASALVAEQPLTFGELGRLLRERWPQRPEIALAQTARALVPMVQLPPRGVWGRSGRALHGLAADRIDRPFAAGAAPDRLVLRYLAAFGPATVADVQTWSGLTRLAEVVDRLRPRLRTDRAEDGRELLDLPDAPRTCRLRCGSCRSTTTCCSATPTAAGSCRSARPRCSTSSSTGRRRWSTECCGRPGGWTARPACCTSGRRACPAWNGRRWPRRASPSSACSPPPRRNRTC